MVTGNQKHFTYQTDLTKKTLPELYNRRTPSISFELFPPKNPERLETLKTQLPKLAALNPSLFTITHGAMGSAHTPTLELCSQIKNRYGIEVAHHLTCRGLSSTNIDAILSKMREQNIHNILALRGDPPREELEFVPHKNGYQYANKLVKHIHDFGGFSIGVAGYPESHKESPNTETDMINLKRKVDAGSDVIFTQLFFDNSHFYQFMERCQDMNISIPIIPGLMPPISFEQIIRISTACGASIPSKLLRSLQEAKGDKDRIHDISISHTSNQAKDLLKNGVPGIHFYVLNEGSRIAKVMNNISSFITETPS